MTTVEPSLAEFGAPEPIVAKSRSPFADIDEQVLRLFAMVTEGLAAATRAFLDDDRDAAREVVAAERDIDLLAAAGPLRCLRLMPSP